MKVRGKNYRAVWMEGGDVVVINQPLLPHQFKQLRLRTHQETADAIRTMIIRGAGTIGATAAYGMAQAYAEAARKCRSGAAFQAYIARAYDTLNETRPTAADLKHALDRVTAAVRAAEDLLAKRGKAEGPPKGGTPNVGSKEVWSTAFRRNLLGGTFAQFQKRWAALAREEAQAIADEYVARGEQIAQHGLKLIKNHSRILTHCNAGWLALVDWGSAPAPIYLAHRKGRKVFVWVDETRPRNQGATFTSWEFMQEGIPHKIIADNAGGHYMRRGEVDLCIVGADRIAANGDVANKIGTYQKAVLARENRVPFYVAAPSSTIDLHCATGDDIPIEERHADEMHYVTDGKRRVRLSPRGAQAANPAFDVTPAKYITGIITEKGIVNPGEIRKIFAN